MRVAKNDRTIVERAAHRKDEITTKLPLPFFLEREAVPADIEKKASGNTMKTPSLRTISEMNVMPQRKAALFLNVSSNAIPMAAAAR